MPKNKLKSLGYTDRQISIIFKSHFYRTVSDKVMIFHFDENFKYFTEELKLPKEIVHRATTSEPSILISDKSSLVNKIDDWIKYGVPIETLMDMFKEFSTIITYDINLIKEKVKALETYGFTKEIILEMAKKYPNFLGHASSTLTHRIDDIKKLADYSNEDIVQMARAYPQLLSLDVENNIKKKFNVFVEADYTKEEIRIITLKYPTAYGNSVKTLRDKLSAVHDGNLKEDILENPRNLIQSALVTRARSFYYVDHKEEIIQKKGIFIFSSNVRFKRITKLAKNELLEIYKERLKVA